MWARRGTHPLRIGRGLNDRLPLSGSEPGRAELVPPRARTLALEYGFDGGEHAVSAESISVASVLRFDRACDALLREPSRARA